MRIFFLLVYNLTILFYIAQKGQIVGKVVDKPSNAPISYVTVSLLNFGDSTLVKGVISNEQGEFRIENIVLNKSYLLRFSFIGYQKQAIDIFPEETTQSISIVLEPKTKMVNEVLINADKNLKVKKLESKNIEFLRNDFIKIRKTALVEK